MQRQRNMDSDRYRTTVAFDELLEDTESVARHQCGDRNAVQVDRLIGLEVEWDDAGRMHRFGKVLRQ